MKLLVIFGICMCILKSAAVSTDIKTKMSPKGNSIQLPQKAEMVYQQTNGPTQTEFVPMQLVQKPLFVPQAHPQPTMLIIAQPALVPAQNLIYGGHPVGLQQQLLHYFHTNPQAKYQLLYGGYQPHPTAQTIVQQAPIAAATVPAFQIVPNPVLQGYNHLVAAPSQIAYAQAAAVQNHLHAIQQQPVQVIHQQPIQAIQQQPIQAIQHQPIQAIHQQAVQAQPAAQPMQLNQIAQLAQMAAQQYSTSPFKFPPIITGFENFTPEQQQQIKAQLQQHLGTSYATASTVPTTTAQYSQQPSTQPSHTSTTDYMQNNDKTNPQAAGSNYSPSLVYRAQYTKG